MQEQDKSTAFVNGNVILILEVFGPKWKNGTNGNPDPMMALDKKLMANQSDYSSTHQRSFYFHSKPLSSGGDI